MSFVGPSGSGKTTLLNLIGCLDKPTEGKLTVADTDVLGLDRKAERRLQGTTHRVHLPGLQPHPGPHGL
ncbi:MAG: ATP-binding cassette domain-containing protein [Desulfobacterales bacterium]|nr:ATP-binding cassette domain-containing protein [Desulfobacterales bacterium]